MLSLCMTWVFENDCPTLYVWKDDWHVSYCPCYLYCITWYGWWTKSCTTLLESHVECERRVGWEWDAREMRARWECDPKDKDWTPTCLNHFWEHSKDMDPPPFWVIFESTLRTWTPTQVSQNFELVWNRSDKTWTGLKQVKLPRRCFWIWHSRRNLRNVA
jgi:hypothetical protein